VDNPVAPAIRTTLSGCADADGARGRDHAQSAVVRDPGDDPTLSDDELLARRNGRFEPYATFRNVHADEAGGPYSCPCCGHATLAERGVDDICTECGWQDDGQDDHDALDVRGGPNGDLSLDAARRAYLRGGGVPRPHRPPAEPT
jgi:hypothetical protein